MSDLERDYSPSSRVGGSAGPFIRDYEVRSDLALATLAGRAHRQADGSQWVEHSPGAPLLVFVHGGYWQALSAADSMYLAPGALAAGWSFAAVEYTLAPAAGIAAMVHECGAALADVVRAVSATGAPRAVVLCGHSAGAHLAAMVSVVATPPVAIDRLVLLSGVYDLRPLVHTTVNEPLGLGTEDAVALSPLLAPVGQVPPVLLAVGEVETDAFHTQQRDFAAHLHAAGGHVSAAVVPGRHHFDIVDDLVDPTAVVGAFVLEGKWP